MNKRFRIGLLAFFVFSALSLGGRSAHAQLTADQQQALKNELAQVLADQKAAEDQLAAAQSQSSSLKRDIAVLDAKIKAAELDIKAKNLLIKSLGNDISDKQAHIEDLEGHIAKGKESLADIMRKTNELDGYSLPEVLLSQKTIAGFFADMDSFQSVQSSLQDVFDQLKADASSTAAEKDALDKRRNATMDARYAIQQQQQNIQADELQQTQLLAISKGNEKSYATLVAQKQAKAAQIRAQLFSLNGVNAISFGDALGYANTVSAKTGVPPALLLAILTQETNLGKNVGNCYLRNVSDGSGIKASSGAYAPNVMKPGRDVQPFIDITSALGLDPYNSLVSCQLGGYGYGGGMGPAQFIASTWILSKDRLAADLGIAGMPNPWNPAHAFMAAGMYLADLGGNSNSYTAQRNAACKYYSGRSCSAAANNASYGSSVMALADKIQREQINVLQGI